MDLEYNPSFDSVLHLLAAFKDAAAIEQAIKKLKAATEENHKVQKETDKKLAELEAKSNKLVEQQQKLDKTAEANQAQVDAFAKRQTELDVTANALYDRDARLKEAEKTAAERTKHLDAWETTLRRDEIELQAAETKVADDRAAYEKDVVELRRFLNK